MNGRTFGWFVAPSVVMMLVFIAFPLVFVFVQSFHATQSVFETVKVESCTPGFLGQVCKTEERTRPKLDAAGRPMTETSFIGLAAYRTVLQPDAVWAALAPGGGGLLAAEFLVQLGLHVAALCHRRGDGLPRLEGGAEGFQRHGVLERTGRRGRSGEAGGEGGGHE